MFVTEFHGTETVQLTASAPDVFNLLVDVDRLPEWNAHVHNVIEQPERPLEEGVEWVIQVRAMGTSWPSRAHALTVDRAGLRFEHRSCSDDGNPSCAPWSWRVIPTPPGSTLTGPPPGRRPGCRFEAKAEVPGLAPRHTTIGRTRKRMTN
jgi:hypothetical protein